MSRAMRLAPRVAHGIDADAEPKESLVYHRPLPSPFGAL
jgi:hypothetical protein